jgi:divalent metal cation (Fe/Co/Zn/Cd) transporter
MMQSGSNLTCTLPQRQQPFVTFVEAMRADFVHMDLDTVFNFLTLIWLTICDQRLYDVN